MTISLHSIRLQRFVPFFNGDDTGGGMAVPKALSVSEVAKLCNVGRTNVGYWIRSKKLRVYKVGRNYSVPADELIYFLKKDGRPIPDRLRKAHRPGILFRSFQNCWNYFEDSAHGRRCPDCAVFRNRLPICFTVRSGGAVACPKPCEDCRYYQETYLSRIRFVHQIEAPAAIYRQLHILGGNLHWARLIGVDDHQLLGMGVEKMLQPESLQAIISAARIWAQQEKPGMQEFELCFNQGPVAGQKVPILVYSLNEPAGSFLFIAAASG